MLKPQQLQQRAAKLGARKKKERVPPGLPATRTLELPQCGCPGRRRPVDVCDWAMHCATHNCVELDKISAKLREKIAYYATKPHVCKKCSFRTSYSSSMARHRRKCQAAQAASITSPALPRNCQK